MMYYLDCVIGFTCPVIPFRAGENEYGNNKKCNAIGCYPVIYYRSNLDVTGGK